VIWEESADWYEQWLRVWATNIVRFFLLWLFMWHTGVYWSSCESDLFSGSLCFHPSLYPRSELHHQLSVITVWYGSLHFLSRQQCWMRQHRRKKGRHYFLFFSPQTAVDMKNNFDTRGYLLFYSPSKTQIFCHNNLPKSILIWMFLSFFFLLLIIRPLFSGACLV